jgi:hypothetical protein
MKEECLIVNESMYLHLLRLLILLSLYEMEGTQVWHGGQKSDCVQIRSVMV